MNVDEMEAGPEMDALVGAGCGFKPRVTWHTFDADGCATLTFDTEGEARRFLELHPELRPCYRVGSREHWPCFSKDMGAAWLVVEKLQPTKPLRLQWCFWVPVWSAEFGEHVGYAFDAPLALCRAALKTKAAAD